VETSFDFATEEGSVSGSKRALRMRLSLVERLMSVWIAMVVDFVAKEGVGWCDGSDEIEYLIQDSQFLNQHEWKKMDYRPGSLLYPCSGTLSLQQRFSTSLWFGLGRL
jgi:hypothetical protein